MPHDGNSSKPNPNLDWFGKIQSDIANSAAGLAGSKALAQQIANINASMKLGTSPYIDFKNSGVMQALSQVQTSANAASAFLKMRDDQTFKAVEAIRRGMNMGFESSVLKEMTGLQTSMADFAKIGNPLPDISAFAGTGEVIPPKNMLAGLNFSAVTQGIAATQALSGQALVVRGLTELINQATKDLTAPEQLLKQMQGLGFSPGAQIALKGYPAAFPDFEEYSAASKIVGEHYRTQSIDSVLRGFERLENELNLDVPVETPDDIDDLVGDAQAVEYVENQITENGALKPSISQALFGFNLNELPLTQSGSLVAFGGSVIAYMDQVLGLLLAENVTAARFFTVAIIYFIPVYGAAMVGDGELGEGKDLPAA
ncbi:hypothetical protein [Corynebacterium sp. NML180780]|uniref:hypothetical protein n=1 Tax=Corynebacterium sp. NML180780 TaxID=2598459 RepID=UPI0011958A82|nr:hypothetical protein [Corynebacterium sp. NML180780]TVX75842.1 hypothetical protein FPP74_11995 [Corynebacterium sp. NML180780]